MRSLLAMGNSIICIALEVFIAPFIWKREHRILEEDKLKKGSCKWFDGGEKRRIILDEGNI